MAISFGTNPASGKPENHEDLLAALNQAVGEAINGGTKKTSSSRAKKARLIAAFALRIIIGIAVLGAALWAVGYVLAWQNILPYTPEWWHGFAIAFAWWSLQTIMPPQFLIKRVNG